MNDKSKKILKIVLIVLVGVMIGYFVRPAHAPVDKDGHTVQDHEKAGTIKEEIDFWTCSMHPQIKMPKPGKCPICGMDLIPVMKSDKEGSEDSPRTLIMSETGKKLAEIETSPVEKKFVMLNINLVGKVDYDETKLSTITARFPGRLNRLFVDFTGVSVSKGDKLALIYSPELISAQEEYLLSVRNGKNTGSEMDKSLYRSSREKLRLWGFSDEQIDGIEKEGKVRENLTIFSPASGIVIEKHMLEGDYIKTGSKIYTIVDLTQLWLKLDAYESDMSWIKFGQNVKFTVEAFPGEAFNGVVSFIDPVLNEKTRTIKVRVNVKNPDNKLKPGMFVHAVVESKIAGDGIILDENLSGKCICANHPDVVSDSTCKCQVCDTELVKTEEMGYSNCFTDEYAPLIIPFSAPLITGKRAVVYVEVKGKDRPVYEGREITLGPRAGDYYIVKSGLKEGEMVVTKGNFKIDSALQIQAKPSMMNPEGGVSFTGHEGHGSKIKEQKQEAGSRKLEKTGKIVVSSEFVQVLKPVYLSYFKVQKSLAFDDLKLALEGFIEVINSLEKVDMGLVQGEAHNAWMEILKGLKNAAVEGKESKDITKARLAFKDLSDNILKLVNTFDHPGEKPLRKIYCSMAFDNNGANWLQTEKGDVANPYFGSAMNKCGEVVETYPPVIK